MGSPPKTLKPLIDTDKMSISNFTATSKMSKRLKTLQLNGKKSLGTLSSIDFGADPLVYGPHATCAVNSRNITLMKKMRPLSKIKSISPMQKAEAELDIFGLKIKEQKARKSPYLSHLKQQKREEMLMELGSIVNTIDDDLSIEVQLKAKLTEIITKSQGNKMKGKRKKGKALSTKLDPIAGERQRSPAGMLMYDVDSLNTESDYDLSEFESGWGFNEGPVSDDGLDLYLSEFENDLNFDKDYINISPLTGGAGVADEEGFGPEIFIHSPG